jgi:thiol-disulfide isomerase/thioredoxin
MWSPLEIFVRQTCRRFWIVGRANRPGEPRLGGAYAKGAQASPYQTAIQFVNDVGISPRYALGVNDRARWVAWLLALICLSPMAGRAQISPGDAFPALTGVGLTGGTLPDTAGHVVLVDFWASWCAPCKASFPAFARLNADYGARGLVIVAVSVDEKLSAY